MDSLSFAMKKRSPHNKTSFWEFAKRAIPLMGPSIDNDPSNMIMSTSMHCQM